MKIGIDVSQLAYDKTGIANYLGSLIESLLKIDKTNEYVLFFASLRKRIQKSKLKIQNYNSKVKIKEYKLPPLLLDLLWNRLHVAPIEWFIGDVDIFITSDWTEPPVKKAKKATILYDLLIYKYPKEMDKKIIQVQQQKLNWVKKESDIVFCISESTKKDAVELLRISQNRLRVIHPGL